MMQNKQKQSSQIDNTQSSVQVFQSYNKLMQLIVSLNQKVEKVIQKHQCEFLLAYQNHVRKINIQLAQIRRKADENQKQMKQSNKLMFLQRQITLFRQQSLKLYDRLEEKTHQAQIYKSKSIDLQKTLYLTQKQIRQAMKNKKTLQVRLKQANIKIEQLQNELQAKSDQIQKLSLPASKGVAHTFDVKKYSMKQKLQKSLINSKKNSIIYSQNRKRFSVVKPAGENQLRQWFLQCIKTVKKDVASRKNSTYQFDLQQIHSIDEFKMVDKLKLLQKFLQNQKLLTWLYEKIFPSRTEQIKDYFSAKNISNFIPNDQNNQISQEYSQMIQKDLGRPRSNHSKSLIGEQKQKIEIILPKMKAPKSQVRNRIAVKQGKLSLSNF